MACHSGISTAILAPTEIFGESVASTLDFLFKSSNVDTTSAVCGLTATQYVACYTLFFDLLKTDEGRDQAYQDLHEYITQICKYIVAAAPRHSELALVQYYMVSYERYRWAMHYTARLFAYGERYYIPDGRRRGRGWLEFDPSDETFLYLLSRIDDDLDAAKDAMMAKVLERRWGLPRMHTPKDMELVLLRAEVASNLDKVVGIKAMGLRQWRIEIIEPWLRSNGRERLQNELKTTGLGLQDMFTTGGPAALEIGDMAENDSLPPGHINNAPDEIATGNEVDALLEHLKTFGKGSSADEKAQEEQVASQEYRVSEILQLADMLCKDGVGFSIIFRDDFKKELTFMTHQVLPLFIEIFYGTQLRNESRENPTKFNFVRNSLFLHFSVTTPSHLFARLKFLVEYLEQGMGERPIQDLLESIGKIPEWTFTEKTSFKNAWYTLWHLLGFPAEIPIEGSTFQEQIHKLFPPQQRAKIPHSFALSCTDFESVDLTVKPTTFLHEHFQLHGNVVKVFKLGMDESRMLLEYKHNRAAKALGIATLGHEIIASLHALYAKDQLFAKAKELEILALEDSPYSQLALTVFQVFVDERSPRVLAHRAYTLEKLVAFRRSFWPSLIRDIQKQSHQNPFQFYGAILAVFFGICSFIQTIASVWALVIAIRAA